MQKLLEHHHRLDDIAEYPLDRFVTFLDAAGRAEARSRIAFVTDMSAVVGALFGGNKHLTEHLDLLNDIVTGE